MVKKAKPCLAHLARFGVEDTLNFFESRNLPIKIEAEKRAFPVSNKAEDVWKVMTDYLKEHKVDIFYNSPIVGLLTQNGKIRGLKLKDGPGDCA
jgi:predicted flavoprotein YhiN